MQGASSCRLQQLIDYWKNLNEMEFIISGILRVLSLIDPHSREFFTGPLPASIFFELQLSLLIFQNTSK